MAGHFEIAELLDDAGWLRSLAASLIGDGTQADDLVQDTWLAALRRPPRAAGESRPWLARVARNLARNTKRDRSRRAAREEFAHEERALPGPDALAQQAEAQRLLAEAVTRLPEPLRDAIVLRYFQGLDSRAAAARLGVPASTVRTRLQKALEELRADLDRRFEGGRAGWGLVLAPLARGARVSAGHAPAPAAGAGSLGSLSPALLATAGGVCALAVAGSITWRGARIAGEGEVVTAAAPLGAVAAAPQAVEAHSAGGREPQAALPASAAGGASRGAAAPERAPMVELIETELSGTILVDGRPPEWLIELTLEPDIPPAVPGDMAPRRRMRRDVLEVEPEVHGKFTFGKLSRSWSGRLIVSDFPFANGEHSMAIDAPRSNLVLALHSEPAIVGRILDPAGQPVARLEGGWCALRLGRSGQPATDVTIYPFACRADGRFRIQSNGPYVPFGDAEEADDEHDWGSLALLVEAEVGYLHHETSDFVQAEGYDLGDLRLEPVHTLAFTVKDPRGTPIEGAFARIGELAWARRSAGTGRDGSGRLAFAPGRGVEVCISAPGYSDGVLAAQPGVVLECVLEPLSVLDVLLVGSLGAQADRLVLSAERPVFVWDASGWDERAELQAELGSIMPAVRRCPATGSQRFEYGFQRQYDGRFHLVGLVPDVPLTVEVRDEQGRVLATDAVSVASQASGKLELGDPNTPGVEPTRAKMPMRRSAASPR